MSGEKGKGKAPPHRASTHDNENPIPPLNPNPSLRPSHPSAMPSVQSPETEPRPQTTSASADRAPSLESQLLSHLAEDRIHNPIYPSLSSFASNSGFEAFSRTVNEPIQALIAEFIALQHAPALHLMAPITLSFSILQAKNLIPLPANADGSKAPARSVYCQVQFGAIENPRKPVKGTNGSKVSLGSFMTQVSQGFTYPIWNETVELTTANVNDSVVVTVWDWNTNDFLGMVCFTMLDILTVIIETNEVPKAKWIPLEPRDFNNWGKFVGGLVMLETDIDRAQLQTSLVSNKNRATHLTQTLRDCGFNFSCLYNHLLTSTCALLFKMGQIPKVSPFMDMEFEPMGMLSAEARQCMRLWEIQWNISPFHKRATYLELVFDSCKKLEVPCWTLLNAYEDIHIAFKNQGSSWISDAEKRALSIILNGIYDFYVSQVCNYKEIFRNRAEDLDAVLLLLRMISKNIDFTKDHPELPTSFRKTVRSELALLAHDISTISLDVVLAAAKNQFATLHTSVFAVRMSTDVSQACADLTRFTASLLADLHTDYGHFRAPFEAEVDIVKAVGYVYLEQLGLILTDFFARLPQHVETVSVAGVIGLLQEIKELDEFIATVAPGLKKESRVTLIQWSSEYMKLWLARVAVIIQDWGAKTMSLLNSNLAETSKDYALHSFASLTTPFLDALAEDFSKLSRFDAGNGVGVFALPAEFSEVRN
ncbi:hypothetical protein BC830DRAFT_1174075 [Chytriomyces sp. MP71]|nr:hypothetical protein BC830DRAFT_1174075 [Chytriomyces sp. MP71]